jgi:ribonuclease E
MLDNEPTGGPEAGTTPTTETADNDTPRRTRARSTRSRAAKTAAGAGAATEPTAEVAGTADEPTAPARRRRRRTAEDDAAGAATSTGAADTTHAADTAPAADAGEAPAPARRSRRRGAAAEPTETTAAPAAAQTAAPAAEPTGVARPSGTAQPATGQSGVAHPITGQSGAESGEPEPAAAGSSRRRTPPTVPVLFMAPEVTRAEQARESRAARAEAAHAEAAHAEADRAESTRGAVADTDAARSGAAEEAGEGEEAGAGTRPSRRSRRSRRGAAETVEAPADEVEPSAEGDEDEDEEDDESAAGRRRRRRGRRGRGRGKGPGFEDDEEAEAEEPAEAEAAEEEAEGGESVTRRRRRRRRGGSSGEGTESTEDGVLTVVRVRPPRTARDEVQGVSGSTRLEAKRQRRRDGRDQRRTRPPILSESEFLARREAVDRVMVVREKGDRTQIAVLEDGVLVEHYVTRASSGTMVGNVYLGKVQNVLPSMEAAFIDIGRGRNGVLYAGEVNWDAAGLEGRARSIEQALKSGDSVLVQVTKDPIGHKGARLTSHLALSGRHLVYVPGGNTSGISRKLADTERKRLRDVLKHLVPESAGVIVRTAAEGAAEDELERDVTRLQAQWEEIERKSQQGGAPVLLYEEPDLVIRVVRDLFNEDFRELVVQGNGAYEMVDGYLEHVSPDLVDRLHRHTGTTDVFAARRIDEQILKGLDRKVYLPSGGSLVIDRTEAMTVIDVNTGKYTGTGGNLEETVTRNNLEAAEEIVRQLRLRDLGGIVVIDFIDMVLESNRELVLRRLTECLGRDRTKHQVTEITSLGLVQMTRKRIGLGLLESFSETCEHCKGRGVIIHTEPVPERKPAAKATAEVASAAINGGRRRGHGDDDLAAATSTDGGQVAVVTDAGHDGGQTEEPADDADHHSGGGAEPATASAPAKRRTLWSSRRRSR